MDSSTLVTLTATGSSRLARGEISRITDEGGLLVAHEGAEISCQRLHVSEGPDLHLEPGDAVLVWFPDDGRSEGVVLGRIGPRRRQAPERVPDEVVIEARENLVLKCGEGSITFRADGKILIKGTDLVSHAKKLNRIRGGSVAIN